MLKIQGVRQHQARFRTLTSFLAAVRIPVIFQSKLLLIRQRQILIFYWTDSILIWSKMGGWRQRV